MFGVLLLNSSRRKSPLCWAMSEGWRGKKVSPSHPGWLLKMESFGALVFFSQGLLPPGSSHQAVTAAPEAQILWPLDFPLSTPAPHARRSVHSQSCQVCSSYPFTPTSQPVLGLASQLPLPSLKSDQQSQLAQD